jgi:hypothetical protein
MNRSTVLRAGAAGFLVSAIVAFSSEPMRAARAHAQAAGASALTAAQWQADLDALAVELPKRHKNLFSRLPAQEFRRQADALRAEIPRLDDDAIVIWLMRLGAAPGDAHTGIGFQPRRAVPVMTYWFKEGVFVLNTTAEYADLLDARLVAIEGKPLDDVMKLIAGIIPHENQAQVKSKALGYLSSTEILHGLGVIPTAESVRFSVIRPDGRKITRDLRPADTRTRPAWMIGPKKDTEVPLYRRKQALFYWFEYLPDDRALYIKYNSCREMPTKPFADFTREAFAVADAHGTEKLIIDLRNNGGGDSGLFQPFLDEIGRHPAFKTKGGLFVIVGRQTFSSAILNALELRREAGAILAGEPTGGKPNHFGEVQTFRLPNSGLPVSYSTKYFQETGDDPDSIYPDILVETSIADYRTGVDPVLARILKVR